MERGGARGRRLAVAIAWGRPLGLVLGLLLTLALLAAVAAAIHHAEVVAHRVGEPFGTLVLAVSVTVIDTASTSVPNGSPTRCATTSA